MAESITYADLRFVKSPLKKTLSAKLKQVPEVDEDGELTYENVQVPSAKDVFPSPAQPGLGGQTGGEKTEKPVATPYSVTSPIARRILPYMQISHQLRNTKQVLEVTNGSLLQQLQIGAIQLSRKEKDLHAAREELAQTQQNLEVEKGQHQAAEDYLLTCRSEKNKTELSLKDNMEEKRNLEEKLKTLQNGLKQVRRLLPCLFQSNGQESRHPHQFPDYYCPLGWTQFEGKCLYISSSQKTWKQSNSFCQSLSSKLFVLSSRVEKDSIMEILKREKILNDIWIQGWQWNNKRDQDHNTYQCATLNRPYSYYSTFESCNKSLLFMCEKEAITRPVELEDYLCH
ncbi:B-cell differentiation antigen CD72 isoform X2 [Trichosurus vulpecula]|uniref:B-cell differentiation antigen CD72 isoform X2 n=1 Tax=Trichosurus vulpecula TaxID=9337 RepID=UPI00186B195A|nr:B-cell differentiation antigen CD72 isoform X2 [Trichosurus vulpecula]